MFSLIVSPLLLHFAGIYDATIKAVETTDAAIGQILDACQRFGYVLVITADHGNAEEMLDAQGF